jgi:tetratricopeptide (TPR) repeat protein
MRRLTFLVALILTVAIASTASAQVRGRGRLQGTVTDKATGKPVEGAVVTVGLPSGNTQPIVTKTDSKGHWSALGLINGQWNIDIVAAGYQTTRGSASVSEMQQLPMIRTQLAAEVKQEAAPVAVAPTPLLPKEVVDTITEGQEFMTQSKYKEAVVDFEKAYPLVPVDKPDTKKIHDQLSRVLAQAYYRAGDLGKAIAMLESVIAADPSNVPEQVLLANLYLQNGQLDKGRALLEKLPPSAITDPGAYINVGILFLNKNNPTDAVTYFSKAIDMNAKAGDAFYYRGLAYTHLKKTAEARSDFEQVLALAPDSPEAKDAKAMLAALPKK